MQYLQNQIWSQDLEFRNSLTNSNSLYRQWSDSWFSQFEISFKQKIWTISERIFLTLMGECKIFVFLLCLFLFFSVFVLSLTSPNDKLYKALFYQILLFIILFFLILVSALYNFNSTILSFIPPYVTFILLKKVTMHWHRQISNSLPGVKRLIISLFIHSNLHEQVDLDKFDKCFQFQ